MSNGGPHGGRGVAFALRQRAHLGHLATDPTGASGLIVACLLGCATVPPPPDPLRPAGYYPEDPLPEGTAYLTFDDGPGPYTEAILDTLAAYGAAATFFVCAHTPDWPDGYPNYDKVIRRIAAEGHLLGNHSDHHPDLATLDAASAGAELDANEERVQRALGGGKLTWIRPPFGSPWMFGLGTDAQRRSVGSVIARRGLLALWSKDSSDAYEWAEDEWVRPDRPPPEIEPVELSGGRSVGYAGKVERIYRTVVSALVGQGEVVLLHDSHPTTRDALPRILATLKERGYRFATLEDWARWRYGKSSPEMAGR